MDRKYSGEQILNALSEVGIGAGDISEVMGYLGRMSLAELNNNSTELDSKNDELIRKQDVIDDCMKYNGQGRIWSCIMVDIEKLPSVEPKIIRCKDCKWWWQREVKINLCPGGGLLTDGEWFCGNAERINDE